MNFNSREGFPRSATVGEFVKCLTEGDKRVAFHVARG